MIYSKTAKSYVPVNVTTMYSNYNNGMRDVDFVRYMVKDEKIPVGFVDLYNTETGIFVSFIKNLYPEKYSGFGKIADQIEVEHCLKRGLKNFDIVSKAGLNSHAMHYLRGKRFLEDKYNKMVEVIISNTQKGQKFYTEMLGLIDMYMPKELINKYIEIIKKSPLLK